MLIHWEFLILSGIFGLIIGSFLNVVATRGLAGESLLRRSACPTCETQLRWFELIPLVSFIFLKGRCRTCHAPISWWYPFIEVLTATTYVSIACTVPIHYLAATLFCASALIVTIRTDGEQMLILDSCSRWMIPVCWLCSWLGWLPLTITDSILGSVLGWGCCEAIRRIYAARAGREGLGAGDRELLGFLGALHGPLGTWIIIAISSIGSLIYVLCMIAAGRIHPQKFRTHEIPFGVALAITGLSMLIVPWRVILHVQSIF